MTAPIVMDSDALSDAAKLYEAARSGAEGVVNALGDSLDSNWGCAGTDSAGRKWSEGYDPAAFEAVAAGAGIVDALGKLHDLLAFTAVNHSNTEKANKNPPEAADANPSQLPEYSAPAFKGAFGGDSDPPFGWGLVSGWLQGHTWPNGNPDKLRALGTAWNTAANGLREASSATGGAWSTLGDLESGEVPRALAQMYSVSVAAEEIASQFSRLAYACDCWAQAIEDAHRKILAILAGVLGVGLIAAGVAGFFPAGTGAALVAGSAGSSAAASVGGVLVVLDGAAVVQVGAVAAAGVAIGGAVTQIQPLLEGNPTGFAMDNTGGDSVSPPDALWQREFGQLPDGRSPRVREAPSEEEMRGLFDRWTTGAQKLPARGDKVPEVNRLDDGTVVQWRTSSRSGGQTIDIYPEGAKPLKVHLP
ncbi:hypothetical protein G4X40_02495 [Rhodococcus sp. D2-41]|uniref:Outer membrane channel protein CpnT-like N-terminal domain-containing protein n=1 Tax=Speluncibacter jeojiensis TaxID=2710754 RepID=A0A9X4M6Y9_9ACTN|nr:hypothetical protein [Rhodococcus sp. D2-41]MDG3009015.1 hypothetical protein [Rhodococcus sp. D2-41]MDG3015526.1 hypothetical protein [Corynebacteriales bacterium D3-21]